MGGLIDYVFLPDAVSEMAALLRAIDPPMSSSWHFVASTPTLELAREADGSRRA